MKLNQRGQMVVESILLMIVMLAVVNMARSSLKESDAFKSLVQGPWRNLSGMIQSGAWAPPEQAIKFHPNRQSRHRSIVGESPK